MSKLPDYNLSAYNKETKARGTIGAAWINDDGSISIRLNPMVVITDHPDVIIKLFKPDHKPASRPPNMSRQMHKSQPTEYGSEGPPDPEDVPF